MNLSDTFYVALCMTVLILGAVYWFWTQNQFMLRKLSMLENIVYEMKMALSTEAIGGGSGSGGGGGAASGVVGGFGNIVGASGISSSPAEVAPVYAPAPGSVMSDDDAEILNDDLHMSLNESSSEFAPIKQDSPLLEVSDSSNVFPIIPPVDAGSSVSDHVDLVADDLQPGGVGSGISESVKTGSSAYDSMTLKELRRLAENRGITGAKDMRKQALIDALRNAPTSGTFNLSEGVLELN